MNISIPFILPITACDFMESLKLTGQYRKVPEHNDSKLFRKNGLTRCRIISSPASRTKQNGYPLGWPFLFYPTAMNMERGDVVSPHASKKPPKSSDFGGFLFLIGIVERKGSGDYLASGERNRLNHNSQSSGDTMQHIYICIAWGRSPSHHPGALSRDDA